MWSAADTNQPNKQNRCSYDLRKKFSLGGPKLTTPV